ncbi:Sensors of blue-light using FAD [Flavobacteriaceae bacterium MAR_2010_188]|nr:Sensors of blue-light using FAD [Flavobacteriaceae bacterium MAR_2010_188]
MLRKENNEKEVVFELTYCSLAKSGVTQKTLEQILREAREFNGDNKITGCLLYHEGEFVQILEGEKETVKKLYQRICNDARHTDISLLSEGIKDSRFFDNWDMAFSELADLEAHIIDKKYFEKNLILLSEMVLKPTRTARIFWSKVRLIMEKSRGTGKESPICAFFLGSPTSN